MNTDPFKKNDKLILPFNEIRKNDINAVGGKAASLGEMLGELHEAGVKVPDGFAVTVTGYNIFSRESRSLYKYIQTEVQKVRTAFNVLQNVKNKLHPSSDHPVHDIKKEYERVNREFQEILSTCGTNIREKISQATMPEKLTKAIEEGYKNLSRKSGIKNPPVAVRSSATAEDLPDASFAGQQDTFLNVAGIEKIKEACLSCYGSLFTNRAISYREDVRHIQLTRAAESRSSGNHKQARYHEKIAASVDHMQVGLSIAVQLMVRSDLASSGVIFSIDPESGFSRVIYITASWGLGEFIVQGRVNPDQHYVFKPTMTMVDEKPGTKNVKLIHDNNNGGVKELPVPIHEQKQLCLRPEEVMQLAEWAVFIEKHYGQAMDIEWAKDGLTGDLYIVQARPETVHSVKNSTEIYRLGERPEKYILSGNSVGTKIGEGKVHIIDDTSKIGEFLPDEILVTDMTNPDWESIMKVAAAIVTNKGGRTCHAAIVSREMGIPCVIGTGHATQILRDGQEVTVDCSEGQGLIYEGKLPYEVNTLDPTNVPKTRTKLMLNIGIPEQAFSAGLLPHDGVGLAREEFVINSNIQIHPLALVHYGVLELLGHQKELLDYSLQVIREIESLTSAYRDKTQYFIDQLAFGVARIGSAFYPEKVIVRLSDFKSNEYANLIGGRLFEPQESNPMIGWRGCSRYYDMSYQAAFILECKALAKVRKEMKLSNVMIMLPFCRTPQEAEKVLEIMREQGLIQGEPNESPLEVYCMAEIPSNIILADEFSKLVDGFSIGSNDLTQTHDSTANQYCPQK
jgi:pyruvate,water dikinase